MNVSKSLINCKNSFEKYSLRPRLGHRAKKKTTILPSEEEGCVVVGKNNNNNVASELSTTSVSNVKQKPATASLSKYRRKTANARERSRMREINLAFETLRKAVPSYMPQLIFSGDGSNEKLTKISTLRLAMKYIKGLTELLHKDNGAYINDDCSNDDIMESHSIIFRDTDTCTLTALNTSTYDLPNSPNYGNDGGSDGESLHSGHIMTSDNVIDISIETFTQADVNFDFSENFFNPELG